jgi:hypothetical protein
LDSALKSGGYVITRACAARVETRDTARTTNGMPAVLAGTLRAVASRR